MWLTKPLNPSPVVSLSGRDDEGPDRWKTKTYASIFLKRVEAYAEGEEAPSIAQETAVGVGPALPDYIPNRGFGCDVNLDLFSR